MRWKYVECTDDDDGTSPSTTTTTSSSTHRNPTVKPKKKLAPKHAASKSKSENALPKNVQFEKPFIPTEKTPTVEGVQMRTAVLTPSEQKKEGGAHSGTSEQKKDSLNANAVTPIQEHVTPIQEHVTPAKTDHGRRPAMKPRSKRTGSKKAEAETRHTNATSKKSFGNGKETASRRSWISKEFSTHDHRPQMNYRSQKRQYRNFNRGKNVTKSRWEKLDSEWDAAAGSQFDNFRLQATLTHATNGHSRNDDRATRFKSQQQSISQETVVEPSSDPLPIMEHRQALMQMVKTNRVSIVTGETGSGKSSKLPQFIREHCAQKGQKCNVICTQPRRLAAMSLARRVAKEMDTELGDRVGYVIGGEKHIRHDTKIVYATTGYLAELFLHNKDAIYRFTHIIIDECHEREIDLDILLNIIREVFIQDFLSPTSAYHRCPKLVLMSATISSEVFSNYFSMVNSLPIHVPLRAIRPNGNESLSNETLVHRYLTQHNVELKPCPTLHIPGRLFQVSESFLDEEMVKMPFIPSKKNNHSISDPNVFKLNFENPSLNADMMEYGAQLIWTMHEKQDDLRQAFLVFLPGIEPIMDMMDKLELKDNRATLHILPLHSTIPPEEQEECMNPPPAGSRKIILSTNIAESSLTIPDTYAVFDFCLTKQMSWNSRYHSLNLRQVWSSLDVCEQRKGRAGRVRNGICIRMIPRGLFQKLRGNALPEMHRIPLDTVILKLLRMETEDSPEKILNRCIEPPAFDTISGSFERLHTRGTIEFKPQYRDEDELTSIDRSTDYGNRVQVTPLGEVLSSMGVDLSLGALVVFGKAFGMLREAVILAVLCTSDNPILHPRGLELMSANLKSRLVQNSESDTIAALNAFNMWLSQMKESRAYPNHTAPNMVWMNKKQKAHKLLTWCAETWISSRWMMSLWNSYRHLLDRLPLSDKERRAISQQDDHCGDIQYDEESITVLKVLLAASHFDNLIEVEVAGQRNAPTHSYFKKRPQEFIDRSVLVKDLHNVGGEDFDENAVKELFEQFQGGCGSQVESVHFLPSSADAKGVDCIVTLHSTNGIQGALRLNSVWRGQASSLQTVSNSETKEQKSTNSGAITRKKKHFASIVQSKRMMMDCNLIGTSVTPCGGRKTRFMSFFFRELHLRFNGDSVHDSPYVMSKPANPKFLVAAVMHVSGTGGSLFARDITALPDVPGIDKLVALIFCNRDHSLDSAGPDSDQIEEPLEESTQEVEIMIRGARLKFQANDLHVVDNLQMSIEHVVNSWKSALEDKIDSQMSAFVADALPASRAKTNRDALLQILNKGLVDVFSNPKESMVRSNDHIVLIPEDSKRFLCGSQNSNLDRIAKESKTQLMISDKEIVIRYAKKKQLDLAKQKIRESINNFVRVYNHPKSVLQILYAPPTSLASKNVDTLTLKLHKFHLEHDPESEQFTTHLNNTKASLIKSDYFVERSIQNSGNSTKLVESEITVTAERKQILDRLLLTLCNELHNVGKSNTAAEMMMMKKKKKKKKKGIVAEKPRSASSHLSVGVSLGTQLWYEPKNAQFGMYDGLLVPMPIFKNFTIGHFGDIKSKWENSVDLPDADFRSFEEHHKRGNSTRTVLMSVIVPNLNESFSLELVTDPSSNTGLRLFSCKEESIKHLYINAQNIVADYRSDLGHDLRLRITESKESMAEEDIPQEVNKLLSHCKWDPETMLLLNQNEVLNQDYARIDMVSTSTHLFLKKDEHFSEHQLYSQVSHVVNQLKNKESYVVGLHSLKLRDLLRKSVNLGRKAIDVDVAPEAKRHATALVEWSMNLVFGHDSQSLFSGMTLVDKDTDVWCAIANKSKPSDKGLASEEVITENGAVVLESEHSGIDTLSQ